MISLTAWVLDVVIKGGRRTIVNGTVPQQRKPGGQSGLRHLKIGG